MRAVMGSRLAPTARWSTLPRDWPAPRSRLGVAAVESQRPLPQGGPPPHTSATNSRLEGPLPAGHGEEDDTVQAHRPDPPAGSPSSTRDDRLRRRDRQPQPRMTSPPVTQRTRQSPRETRVRVARRCWRRQLPQNGMVSGDGRASMIRGRAIWPAIDRPSVSRCRRMASQRGGFVWE